MTLDQAINFLFKRYAKNKKIVALTCKKLCFIRVDTHTHTHAHTHTHTHTCTRLRTYAHTHTHMGEYCILAADKL